ncbi:gamma-glutamyl hydrolase-like [Saccoglossus kowalevskii]
MNAVKLTALLQLLVYHGYVITSTLAHDKPIIGVLSQKTDEEKAFYGNTYIAASYVKFLESSGARVVPILVNQSNSYYQHLFNSING